MSLEEIRHFLRQGRPQPDPGDLGRSLDMLVHYAAAHAKKPQDVESELLQAFEAAISEAEGLDDETRVVLKGRVSEWWQLEHALLQDAARREIDVVFRSVLQTGGLENTRPIFELITRLSQAGRRTMGRVVRDKMVLEFRGSLRTMLNHETAGPQASGGALSTVKLSSLTEIDRLRVLAWTGQHADLLQEINPDSDPKSLVDLEKQALHRWSASVVNKDNDAKIAMGPAPDISGDLGQYLCTMIEGRRQMLKSVYHLRSSTDLEPQNLQALLSGLERLESIPFLSLDADPWVALLIETHAAMLLGTMPVELSFRQRGQGHGKRALERLGTLSSGHPIFSLGIAQIVQASLHANSL